MKRLHGLMVVLLLLAYAGTATTIMPAVVAVLAALDGSHRVLICRTEQGTEVRLHHRDHECTPEVWDHQGMLAKLIVSICRPAEDGDHSLSSNQVTGTLTDPDEEVKRTIKSKQDCSWKAVRFDDQQARVDQEVVFKTPLRSFDTVSAVALEQMATVRLLI